MTVVYVWCDCGAADGPRHYYTEYHCPFSGWVAPHVQKVQDAAEALRRSGKAVTIDALEAMGIDREALTRVLIAEFSPGAEVPFALGIGDDGDSHPLYLDGEPAH